VNFSFVAGSIVLWVFVVFQGLLTLYLLRQLASLHDLIRMGGITAKLPLGSGAPEFTGIDKRSGRKVSLQSLDGQGGLILFVSPECPVCVGLIEGIQQLGAKTFPHIVAFCPGGEQACAKFATQLNSDAELLLEGVEEAATRYRVTSYPTAVVIDEQRKIRGYSHPANARELETLIAQSLRENRGATPEPRSAVALVGPTVSR
jgi:thiol-disulfide isomerase/thioredoxin